MPGAEALEAHLATGSTTVCRCWAVIRRDGRVFGFTDHDRDLAFEGIDFRAGTGLDARAVQQTTGLAVDNSEAVGALSDPAITEADIAAGRFDGAEVLAWLVNWADPEARALEFRGTLGEIQRNGQAFRAELRGLAEALNQPQGRVYQSECSAVLGDRSCGFDTATPGYSFEGPVAAAEAGRVFRFEAMEAFAEHWFERGILRVLGGEAEGLTGVVKSDRGLGAARRIGLWEAIRAPLGPGDPVRIEPGCDKTAATCRAKFDNFLNFRGFPTIPGEDWLMGYPRSGDRNDGGSLST